MRRSHRTDNVVSDPDPLVTALCSLAASVALEDMSETRRSLSALKSCDLESSMFAVVPSNVVACRHAMFRSTTKHEVRSQSYLLKHSTQALSCTNNILCEDIYTTTYGKALPPRSRELLDNVILGLTGNMSRSCSYRRTVHTLCKFKWEEDTIIRVVFIQPELVTSTAHVHQVYHSDLVQARQELSMTENLPSQGNLRVLQSKIEVSGRLAPYIVDRAGANEFSEWTYNNITRSKFMFVVTTLEKQGVYECTKDTLRMLLSFKGARATFVEDPTLRNFSVYIRPESIADRAVTSSNSSVVVYPDGSFRVNGKPSFSYDLCCELRGCFVRAVGSQNLPSLLDTLSGFRN